MKKEIVKINGINKPQSPFNRVIKAGNFRFLSSQLSVYLKTNKILCGNITEQTRQVLRNIKFLFEYSAATMDDIIKMVVYMRDVKDFDEINRVYLECFKKGQEPARVTMQALLPLKNIDIEIKAMALPP